MSLKKYLGDKRFFKLVLAIAIPIVLQNGITNFVSMLDNIMVGRLGTESMSGVAIVNQFVFIFNLLIFGAVSAAGIFTAQYHGLGDTEGKRYTFRLKFFISAVAAVFGIVVFALCGDSLIGLFLHEGSAEGDLALTLEAGKEYLLVMLFGMIPYAISQVYASTMRETGETVVPLIASAVAVLTNFVLNLILIFGYLGAPALGVTGAAIATVVSRFAEMGVLAVWGHTHPAKCDYLVGAFRSLRVPRALAAQIALKGLPLMLNEFFWAAATTMRCQCYSVRGLEVVAALNITSTIVNVFSVVYMSLGSSISIIIGNLLGAGRLEEAKDTDKKMIFFSVLCSAGMGIFLIAFSPLFPLIYNTSADARSLAAYMMIVSAAIMPFCSYANAAYFTLRSGGKVMITLLFDSVFMWAVVMPVVYLLSRFTDMSILWLYPIGQGTEILKCLMGYFLLRRGVWVRQLVADDSLKS